MNPRTSRYTIRRTTAGIIETGACIKAIRDHPEEIHETAEEISVKMAEIVEATDEQAISAEKVTMILR